ncbi:MAG: metalloregulator ArsR/SmtB family transcription factor [Candidatus Omnitrophota bacterium]|jgi:ArsR family transcriptional regulator
MDKLKKTFKALADKNRIRILKLLEKKKMCVCEIAFVLGATQPNISKHLKKLKSAGLICDEQKGFWTNYFLCAPKDIYARVLLKNLRSWLNTDTEIKNDGEKAGKANRIKLCCKGK